MAERRGEPRADLGQFLFNKYIDGFPHVVELLDLSASGMLVRKVHEPDVPRAFYSIELGIPGTPERMWLWTRIAWTRDGVQALRFVGIDPADRARIAHLVREARIAA